MDHMVSGEAMLQCSCRSSSLKVLQKDSSSPAGPHETISDEVHTTAPSSQLWTTGAPTPPSSNANTNANTPPDTPRPPTLALLSESNEALLYLWPVRTCSTSQLSEDPVDPLLLCGSCCLLICTLQNMNCTVII